MHIGRMFVCIGDVVGSDHNCADVYETLMIDLHIDWSCMMFASIIKPVGILYA